MKTKTILFLCSGNYYRSRFAEEYFNHAARENRLNWRADSRGIAANLDALENIGPMSAFAIQELEKRGLNGHDEKRHPKSVKADDFRHYDRFVAMDQSEHEPMIHQRFPDCPADITYWDIKDIAEEAPATACARLARHIDALVKTLSQGTDPPKPAA